MSQELLGGDDRFFEFTDLLSSFDVSLRDSPIPYQSIVNTYDYSVIGTAAGGATAITTGSMRVGRGEFDCSVQTREFTIDPIILPAESDDNLVLADNALDYFLFTSEALGCIQTFSLELANGLAAPDYYSINEATGALTFKNNRVVNEELIVVVSATDGVEPRILDYDYPLI